MIISNNKAGFLPPMTTNEGSVGTIAVKKADPSMRIPAIIVEDTLDQQVMNNPQYPADYVYPMGNVGPMNPYGVQVDTYGNPILSSAVANELYLRSKLLEQKAAYDFLMAQQQDQFNRDLEFGKAQHEHMIEKHKHQDRMAEIEHKAHMAEARDAANEERRRKFEDSTLYPVLDSSGRICLEREYPDGTKDVGKALFKHGNIRVTRIDSIRTQKLIGYRICWDNIYEEIIISATDMNPHKLFKAMSHAGNPLKVGKNRKVEIESLLYGYLMDTALSIELPDHWGWNKVDGMWKFCIDYFDPNRKEKSENAE